MSAKSKPLVTLTNEQKCGVIRELDDGKTPESLATKYNVCVSTIYRIRSNQSQIVEAAKTHHSQKRVRLQRYDEIDKYLIEWFEQARARNLIISDGILQAQALSFGRRMNATDFKASSSWIRGFKKRHGIRSLSLQGEAGSVDHATVENYREMFKDLAKGYEAHNIFNLDETALFFKLLPNKTLCQQAKASGTKTTKERVSVAFCVSSTGEKLLPLVIGKAARPRSFKGLDLCRIGIKYTNSYKSWMTSTIFQEYLKELNKIMAENNRKILLLVDNAPSHIVREDLSHIRVEFLPKDTTSVLQPLDQGIIRSFKAHYKNILINYLIAIGNNTAETMRTINMGMVVNWISEAWEKVSETTIANCSKKTGLFGKEAELLSDDTAERELQAQLTAVKATASVEEYLSADEIDLIYDCSEENLNQEVYERVSTFEQEQEDDDELADRPLKGITRERTMTHVDELRTLMGLATTTTLRQNIQKVIFELSCGVEPLLKQARLDFGPA